MLVSLQKLTTVIRVFLSTTKIQPSEFEIPDIKNVRRPIILMLRRRRRGRRIKVTERNEKLLYEVTKKDFEALSWELLRFVVISIAKQKKVESSLPLRTIFQAMCDCRCWRHKKDKLFSNEEDKLQVVYFLCFHVKNKRRKVKCVHLCPITETSNKSLFPSFFFAGPRLMDHNNVTLGNNDYYCVITGLIVHLSCITTSWVS